MNPYVQTGLVMCIIVFIALVASAWLAVYFNRRGKADLQAALDPLAELIDGDVDLDEATVTGTFEGQIVAARMTHPESGPGRVFQTDLVDPAGGIRWTFTSSPPRDRIGVPTIEFDAENAGIREHLPALNAPLPDLIADPKRERYRVSYDPDAGFLRLVKGMRTRLDIPDTEHLRAQLAFLKGLGDENRELQGRLRAVETEQPRT